MAESIGFSQDDLDRLFASRPDLPKYKAAVQGSILRPGVVLIRVDGRALGVDEASHVISSICQLAKNTEENVILDLTGCSFLSSFALGTVSSLAFQRNKIGRKLVIAGANDTIRDVIKLIQVDAFLGMFPTVEEADRNLS